MAWRRCCAIWFGNVLQHGGQRQAWRFFLSAVIGNYRHSITAIPVLLISGELDGRTPVSNAEAAAAGLIDIRHLLIENAGHDDAVWLAPGVADRIAEFLAGATQSDERLAGPPLEFADSVLGELWRMLVLGDDGKVRGLVWVIGLLLVGLMLLGLRLLQRWIAGRSRRAHAT